jgi:hypothetical protein
MIDLELNQHVMLILQRKIYLFKNFENLDIHLKLYAENAKPRDVISFTVTLSEIQNDVEFDRRGLTTIVHLV